MNDSPGNNNSHSQFVAHLAHDIRGVLNGLQGLLSILEQTNRDQACVEFIEAARSSSSRLTFILNNLLDMARVEAGKLVRQDSLYSPLEAIQSVVEYYAGIGATQGVNVALSMDDRLTGQLLGDTRQLLRILENLLDNALRHAAATQVSVVVRVQSQQDNRVRYTIEVIDNGCGLPAAIRDTVLQPYRNMHDSPGAGSRLGLPLAAALAELIGGRLVYDGTQAGGSHFVLELEQAALVINDTEAQYTAVPQAPGAMPAVAGTNRVLVVDDNDINCKVLKKMLGLFAIEADTATCGNDALQLCNSNEYALVFMDCRMPGMDGLEATRQMRSQAGQSLQRVTPIIALTGDDSDAARQDCLAAGMNDVLYKPITSDVLGNMLVKWLDN